MFKKLSQFVFLCINTVIFSLHNATVVFGANGSSNDTSPSIPLIETLPGPVGGKDTHVSQVDEYIQNQYLPQIAVTIVSLAVAIAVTALIIGAIQFLTSYGNDEKLTTAKKTLTFAFVGLVISILAFAIVQFVFTTGIKITEVKSK